MSGGAFVKQAEAKSKRRRIGRWLSAGLATFLLILCVALFALWQSRLGLAERIVADALTARGISDVSFQISALGFRSIDITDLAIGAKADKTGTVQSDVSASRITVNYALGELLSGRVQSIEVEGLHVNARVGDNGLSLGAADPLLRQVRGTGGASTALPDIQVSAASIHLVTAQGSFDASGDLTLSQADAASPVIVDLPVLHLRDGASPARFAPLKLVAHLNYDGKRIAFDANGSAAPAQGAAIALATITGHYNMDTATASAKANGHLDFAPGRLEPKTLSPLLKGYVNDLRGRVTYQANLSFARNIFSSSGKVDLSDIGFAVGSTTVKGLAGSVKLSNLLPPQTSGVQRLTVAHVETAVPLDNGIVAFSIEPALSPHLVEAAWPFTGGRVTLTSPKGAALNRFDLTLTNIDVEKLLQLIDVPGLSGTGTLSGRFPIKIEDGDPFIMNGALSADGNGVIIYKNAAAEAAANTEQTELLTKALKNFHYTELSGALDGNVNGNLQFHLGLRGANPSLYDGYPIHLNVNLQGSLADLVRRGTVGLRPMELIENGGRTEK
jgi:hypothetical protein